MLIKVTLPNGKIISLNISTTTTVQDVLELIARNQHYEMLLYSHRLKLAELPYEDHSFETSSPTETQIPKEPVILDSRQTLDSFNHNQFKLLLLNEGKRNPTHSRIKHIVNHYALS
jgi:hypothetical protein